MSLDFRILNLHYFLLLLIGAASFGISPLCAQAPPPPASAATGGLSAGQVDSATTPAATPPTPAPTRSTTPAEMPRVFAPTRPRTVYTRYPWRYDIGTTVFWIGETPTPKNPTPNNKSSWDTEWEENYGGYDDPDPKNRNADFTPKGFTPGLNPFYIALPYNDVLPGGRTKSEASQIIPWFKQRFSKQGHTVLKGQWLAIRYGDRICYAQWEDCGPFSTDDWQYVFGNGRPKNTKNSNAGLDISPAVRDYLGFPPGGTGKADWRFVDLNEVPDGPWKRFGGNNDFAEYEKNELSQEQARLQELKRLRDEWFKRQNATRISKDLK